MDQAGHAIRLRGGWEWHNPATPDEAPRRLALPTTWPDDAGTAATLVRRFNRPPIDTDEAVILRLEQVRGLVAARLNEAEVEAGSEIQGLLGPSNRLILEVDLAACVDGRPWGEVALVIAPANPIGDGPVAALS
ncbi:hypothetical protein EP7_005041 [Isosphaeraceae bacterium EP7]